MTRREIVVLHGVASGPAPGDGLAVVSRDQVRRWAGDGTLWRHLGRYRRARIRAYRLGFMSKPILAAIMLRLLSPARTVFEDETGAVREVTAPVFLGLLRRALGDALRKSSFLRRVTREIEELERVSQNRPRAGGSRAAPPLYLRSDFCFGLRSGGSVGHTAGVLNHLGRLWAPPIFVSPSPIPTVSPDIETHLVTPEDRFLDFNELPTLAFNQTLYGGCLRALRGRQVSFVYQRYSLNNYAGVRLAGSLGVPLVLEYNGSEIWVSDNWGTPLRYRSLSERIELLNLRAADLVVVVSEPMRNELADRGVDAAKVLVNPNGVDPDRYSPSVDGSAVRRRCGLDGKLVLGFIGTFGRWHGAEVLAEAFGRLLANHPEHRETVRLLMIGDGMTMPEVRRRIDASGARKQVTLSGLVPQEEGPAHLAACDVLVSPHVPNPDGTPFFGSPTKLFEYMAMGRGIVASRLDQIAQVLEHDVTAWMVEPGSVGSLAAGLEVLVRDEARRKRLGEAARRRAVAEHTWERHTARIVEGVATPCA